MMRPQGIRYLWRREDMSEVMTGESPSSTMLRLLQGAWATQALHVVAVLGIADRLADGPRTAAELAAATDADPDSLYRLLRFLSGLGVFVQEDGAFRLSPIGTLLREDAPGSARERALSYGDYFYRAFGDLLHTVRTGEPAFEHVFGVPAYKFIGDDPDRARSFNRQMQTSAGFASHLPKEYDFSQAKTVVDIAGGNGTLLATLLTAEPHLQGVLFDAPHVVEAARTNLGERGVLDRCRLVAGDFLESIPEGGDVYTLSRILHNWDDTECNQLLANCRDSMRPGAALLVLERLVPEDGSPSVAVAADINMLTIYGGRERTVTEFRTLLDGAGFELTGQRDLPPDSALLIASRR
jgi:ubiquinone/menaquinone biosynthesis C-methylase UbiE